MEGVYMVIYGMGLVAVALYFYRGGASAFRELPQYSFAQWLAEQPRGGCLLSCLLLIWLAGLVTGILWELSHGHLSPVGYVAAVAVLLVIWWKLLPLLNRLNERMLQDSLKTDDAYVRRMSIPFVVLGIVVTVLGVIQLILEYLSR